MASVSLSLRAEVNLPCAGCSWLALALQKLENTPHLLLVGDRLCGVVGPLEALAHDAADGERTHHPWLRTGNRVTACRAYLSLRCWDGVGCEPRD